MCFKTSGAAGGSGESGCGQLPGGVHVMSRPRNLGLSQPQPVHQAARHTQVQGQKRGGGDPTVSGILPARQNG